MKTEQIIHLSGRDSLAFAEALLNPRQPSAKLREAFQAYNKTTASEEVSMTPEEMAQRVVSSWFALPRSKRAGSVLATLVAQTIIVAVGEDRQQYQSKMAYLQRVEVAARAYVIAYDKETYEGRDSTAEQEALWAVLDEGEAAVGA